MASLALIGKIFSGMLLVGIAGSGAVYAGKEYMGLKNLTNKDLKQDIQIGEEFSWEYVLKNDKKVICGSLKLNDGEGAQVGEEKCVTPWTKEIKNKNSGENILGLWVSGNKESVESMLNVWKDSNNDIDNKELNEQIKTEGGINSLKTESKCEIKEKEGNVEIICKFEKKSKPSDSSETQSDNQ
ncbi:hypothetical protein [Mycoplasma suis]|uniref:Uncharacterized protein n=1 Tax=Mycoplasma suis (strain Illinois) TaxID=768700 RepID=F0QRQ2_MYCSL|nr:hypothetical protein [Mycoplasma suis]ADX98172.1 hypothetical protein MSU_0641 [Mycoplasma suis str. Illinois]